MSGAINYDDAMKSLSSMFAALDRQQIHDVLAKHSILQERTYLTCFKDGELDAAIEELIILQAAGGDCNHPIIPRSSELT
jgi:hypothetical protein